MLSATALSPATTLSSATILYTVFVSKLREMSESIAINSKIDKQIIKKGVPGRKPSLNWICGIILIIGNENQKKKVEITLGHGFTKKDRLIERCIETMHLEEESLFTIKLDTETMHKVNITLESFKEKPYIFQWSDGEKLEASKFYKLRGTELFKENKIEEAFYKFSTALKLILLLDSVLEKDKPQVDIINLRVALYNNLASCHLHFKNYPSVVKLCSDSISINPTSKALYRRAIANMELKEYEKAESDLTDLLKLEPRNKAALEKYKSVKELDRANRENYQSIVKKMFS